jgi:isoleucyl-tRNA synthetase
VYSRRGQKIFERIILELRDKSTNFAEVYPAAESRIKNQESSKEDLAAYNLFINSELDLHKPYIDRIKLKCEKCGGESLRVPEVVDCWVESGSMPFAELHYPFENQELFKKRFPADFVVEYIPQTRAWFYVMHVMNTMLFEAAPFKNVMTTGTILAEDGTKMSKSKNNYPDPNLVIEKFGADALRFYLLTSPVVTGEDVNFSEKNVQEVNRKVSLILYNVWTFYRMYEKGKILDIRYQILDSSHILDKWVIAKLSETQNEVTKQMDAYNTVKAGRAIAEFVNELSTWYVRRNRDRIKGGDEAAKQALNTLGYVIIEVCKLLAPFMPFLAEYIFKDVTGKESVHLENWTLPSAVDEIIIAHMQVARQLVEAGLSLRKELNLKVRQPLAQVEYHLKNNLVLPEELDQVIAEELNVKLASGRSDFAPKNGFALKETQEFKLALDTVLTPELKAEGMARELERQVQDLRKKSGLKMGDLVDLYYNTPDEEVEKILLNFLDRKKTFINQVNKSFEVEVDFETQNQLEGKAVWLGMIKV